MHLKRWLFLVHRWLGVLACAFFAMWFVSGVVMMYVGYPKLTEAERLRHLPVLDAAAPLLGPRQALDAAGMAGPLRSLRLAAASGGRAVYLAEPASGRGVAVVDAQTGALLQAVDRAHALASARAYAGEGVAVAHRGTIGEDAFTHSRALDRHRPLHVVDLADAESTRLYVSGSTGEVVRDAPRAERLWNYAGAWIHWLYPLRGGALDPYWADIVNCLSIAGIALALTGTVVGVMRWRFRRAYRSGSHSPYQGFMMRWHHVTGLLFALVTLTWIFSGLMSMNPWRIFDSGAPALRLEAMNGGPLTVAADDATPAALLAATGGGVRELRWVRVAGRSLVLASGAGGRPLVRDARSAAPHLLDPGELRGAVARLLPDPVQRIEVLHAYDSHYYAREAHTMTGGNERPLPVWRVVFGDAHATWVHVDPQTGAVLGRSDSLRRLSRWLFAMLHSWDWLPLLERRPAWDLLLIALSAGGTLLSLTGVVIGWRRLGRKLRASAGRRAPARSARPNRRPA
ncbi:putative iron-regulated membrane protein [Variovorax sp. TBS-050B]|uniref:PepSY domain-containing protein n=1 Tax=Variovorax sp. TBS-050B TaxID=2940551 RepID=UPI002475293A|nr:PepSY domain-containing protein [Variovorax sp. TBS-050B]MDH6590713.1 putative iron-regulated membrane protein [Variovorax sp. TBS-050B]